MAKLKKGAKSAAGAGRTTSDAERLSKTLSESAQQIWLAGVGAFGRAQAEGTRLFEALVKEGMSFEQTARRVAGSRADGMRDAVESRVGQARERAADTWDRLEKVFEDRVQRALVKLGVPNREDVAALVQRVDTLNAELRRLRGDKAGTGKTAARKAPAKKAATRRTKASATATEAASTPARKRRVAPKATRMPRS